MRTNTKLTGALAALAVVATIAAPSAYAASSSHRPSPTIACDPSAVPPPPSLIAASAAKEYAVLRGCGNHRDSTTLVSQPVASAPLAQPSSPTGFDWVSAALGGIAVAGLALVSVAALGMGRLIGGQRSIG